MAGTWFRFTKRHEGKRMVPAGCAPLAPVRLCLGEGPTRCDVGKIALPPPLGKGGFFRQAEKRWPPAVAALRAVGGGITPAL